VETGLASETSCFFKKLVSGQTPKTEDKDNDAYWSTILTTSCIWINMVKLITFRFKRMVVSYVEKNGTCTIEMCSLSEKT